MKGGPPFPLKENCWRPYQFSIKERDICPFLTPFLAFQRKGCGLLPFLSKERVGPFPKGDAKGISANSLEPNLLALICRLSRSTMTNRYLPVDATGDGLHQSSEFISTVFSLFSLGYCAASIGLCVGCTRYQIVHKTLKRFALATIFRGGWLHCSSL